MLHRNDIPCPIGFLACPFGKPHSTIDKVKDHQGYPENQSEWLRFYICLQSSSLFKIFRKEFAEVCLWKYCKEHDSPDSGYISNLHKRMNRIENICDVTIRYTCEPRFRHIGICDPHDGLEKRRKLPEEYCGGLKGDEKENHLKALDHRNQENRKRMEALKPVIEEDIEHEAIHEAISPYKLPAGSPDHSEYRDKRQESKYPDTICGHESRKCHRIYKG